ncbi:MAG TPA: hypothetical protein VD969_18050 [Symbiobacteriaceae bacterium]|nr:hypothetical protein [Symbiobacteriaceae bacterium]
MIKAYDEEWFLSVNPGGDLCAHIRETVLAAESQGVKAAIFQYLVDHNTALCVCTVLNRLTADPRLLTKVRVVTDRQWGTCTMLVTPEEARVAAGGINLLDGAVDLNATLRYWSLHAEAVLVQFADETYAEEKKPLLESLQWLTHWHFKRQFDRVLNQAAN